LLYSTCSLEAEECEKVVEAVVAEPALAALVRILPVGPVLSSLPAAGLLREMDPTAIRGNYLRTLPGVHPGDGFFAALLERKR
jgi:16S rRNA (cytosine967-C5)-methyltransferase